MTKTKKQRYKETVRDLNDETLIKDWAKTKKTIQTMTEKEATEDPAFLHRIMEDYDTLTEELYTRGLQKRDKE